MPLDPYVLPSILDVCLLGKTNIVGKEKAASSGLSLFSLV